MRLGLFFSFILTAIMTNVVLARAEAEPKSRVHHELGLAWSSNPGQYRQPQPDWYGYFDSSYSLTEGPWTAKTQVKYYGYFKEIDNDLLRWSFDFRREFGPGRLSIEPFAQQYIRDEIASTDYNYNSHGVDLTYRHQHTFGVGQILWGLTYSYWRFPGFVRTDHIVTARSGFWSESVGLFQFLTTLDVVWTESDSARQRSYGLNPWGAIEAQWRRGLSSRLRWDFWETYFRERPLAATSREQEVHTWMRGQFYTDFKWSESVATRLGGSWARQRTLSDSQEYEVSEIYASWYLSF